MKGRRFSTNDEAIYVQEEWIADQNKDFLKNFWLPYEGCTKCVNLKGDGLLYGTLGIYQSSYN